MKTRALNLLILLVTFRAGAEGFNTFECLREMIPLTEHGSYQGGREGVERPFSPDERHIAFPEVKSRKVTGFYVYDRTGAYYYDTAEFKTEHSTSQSPVADLGKTNEGWLYQMVAQPGGLETVTIYYMPGFKAGDSNRNGPVILGSSVMPVIGAFVSRPEQYEYVYQSPAGLPESRLRDWLSKTHGGRSPASAPEIKKQIVSLSSKTSKSEKQLWGPLNNELRLRQAFVRDHNLDDQTFKALQRAQNGVCHQ